LSLAFPSPSRERSERSWRRATVVISVGVHVAAALGAIAYSFWHVEELSPPRVTVTFVSAAALPPPPPPPPPPIGGGGGTPRRKAVHKVEAVQLPEVKQPPIVDPPVKPTLVEPVHEVPTPDTHATTGTGPGPGNETGVKGGVAGGVKGGVAGGVVGGVVGATAPPAPKFLPPQMGSQRKLSGADPDFPPVLRKPGAAFVVMAKICVGASGTVDAVTLQKRAEPTLDNNVLSAVKGWRFQPMTANGTPIPFCYFGRFEFKSD
jgi:protein TonB